MICHPLNWHWKLLENRLWITRSTEVQGETNFTMHYLRKRFVECVDESVVANSRGTIREPYGGAEKDVGVVHGKDTKFHPPKYVLLIL